MYQSILILLFFFLCKYGTYYYTENLVGPIFLCILFALLIKKKLDNISAIFFLYVLIHSIYNLYAFPTRYGQFGVDYNHYFKTMLGSGMVFALMFIPLIFIRRIYFKELYKLLIYLPVVNSIIVIGNWLIFDNPMGIIGCTSIDSALIACTLPVLFNHLLKRLKGYYTDNYLMGFILLLPVIAVLILGGSVGIGCLITGFAVILIQRKYFWQLLTSIPIILVVAYHKIGPQLFDSSGRFAVYKVAMTHWWEHMNIWLGSGMSTYWVLGPLLQDKNNTFMGSYFTFMHSDILQFIFEFGLVGLLFLLVFLWNVFYKVIKYKKYMLAPIISYLFFASLYYPIHSFLTALVGAIMFLEVLKKDNVNV